MFSTTRKRVAVLGTIAVLSVTAVAVAYWTTSGSGSGSGTVGSQTGSVTLSGSAITLPTLDSEALSTVTAANSGTSPTKVTQVKIDRVTAAAPNAACNSTDHPTWFTLTDAVAENEEIAANEVGEVLDNKVTVRLNDVDENQDVCQGAVLTVVLSSTSL